MPSSHSKLTSTRSSANTDTVEAGARRAGGQPEGPPSRPPERHIRRRQRYQVVLQLCPGAEPWILVRHEGRTLRFPASDSLLAVWERLEQPQNRRKPKGSTLWVRVPLEEAISRGIQH